MIDGMLESAEENLLNFTGIEDRLPVFDDYTVGRMFEVYGKQKRDFWMYDGNFKNGNRRDSMLFRTRKSSDYKVR